MYFFHSIDAICSLKSFNLVCLNLVNSERKKGGGEEGGRIRGKGLRYPPTFTSYVFSMVKTALR